MKKLLVFAAALFSLSVSAQHEHGLEYGDMHSMQYVEATRMMSDIESEYIDFMWDNIVNNYTNRAISLIGNDSIPYMNNCIASTRMVCHALQEYVDFDMYRRGDIIDPTFQENNLRLQFVVEMIHDNIFAKHSPLEYRTAFQYLNFDIEEYEKKDVGKIKFSKGDILVYDDKYMAICVSESEMVSADKTGITRKQIQDYNEYTVLRKLKLTCEY